MTSEYEIMRGDLVDVFYRASLGLDPGRSTDKKKGVVVTDNNGAVRYQFGTTVTDISQHDDEAATVTFSDGRKARFDLVVAADGQSSRTRRMVLSESDMGFHPLGLYTAYYLVPRAADDDAWMRWHLMPGRRAVFTRSADRAAPTQVYMSVQTTRARDAYGVATALAKSSSSSSSSSSAAVVGAQKEVFAAAFADQTGWKMPALVDALRNTTPNDDDDDDDFYATEIGQVRCERLVRAAWCCWATPGIVPPRSRAWGLPCRLPARISSRASWRGTGMGMLVLRWRRMRRGCGRMSRRRRS